MTAKDVSTKDTERKDKASARGAARFAAVEILYQIDVHATPIDQALVDFNKGSLDSMLDAPLRTVDKSFLTDVVAGTCDHLQDIDDSISKNLPEQWALNRLDPVVRGILRAAHYELFYCFDVPTPVILSEYIDVAKAFYDQKEPGFINGVLDTAAKCRTEKLLNT